MVAKISLRKLPRSKIFDFPKLAPERLPGIPGMVGHAETCPRHLQQALTLRTLFGH